MLVLHKYPIADRLTYMNLGSLRRLVLLSFAIVISLFAQDDLTMQNGTRGYAGGFIAGPASNPLSFLNGYAYRTYGQSAPYFLPDFRPARQASAISRKETTYRRVRGA